MSLEAFLDSIYINSLFYWPFIIRYFQPFYGALGLFIQFCSLLYIIHTFFRMFKALWNVVNTTISKYLSSPSRIFWSLVSIFRYSRVWNKCRAVLIKFFTFFYGLHSLLKRVMHEICQNICYLMGWLYV